MSLKIIRSKDKNGELGSLLRKMSSDIGAAPNNGWRAKKYFIITPARLRPYVEHETLVFLRDWRIRNHNSNVRINVHSFSSLVKSEVPATDVKPILGNFTLRSFLAQRMRHDPETFRRSGEVFGSANQFAQQVTELVNVGVDSDDLNESDDVRVQSLGLLLKAFEARFGNTHVLQGGFPLNAIKWIREDGEYLHFYLHGFERLTAAEFRLVSEMAERSNLVITDDEMFTPDYLRILRKEKISVGITLPEPKSTCPNVSVIPTADAVGEVRMAAGKVQQMLKTIPAGEILVTARDISPYRAILETEFAARGIPLNATPAATMANHPLADLLLGLLDPKLYEHDPNTILRVYRSGLIRGDLKVTRSELDRVENAFIHEDPETLWRFQLPSDHLNETMRKIAALIDNARPVFRPESPGNVRETLNGMVRFLVANRVNMSYKDLRNEDDNREFMFAQTRQVWMKIMDILNEFVENLGDEPYADFESTFADNLESALSTEPLSVKPKALNAVDVVAFPTAMRPYGTVIVLGASESQLPAIPHESGLLDDSERHELANRLESHGKHASAEALLELTVERKARREPLAFSRLLAYANHVVISCPKNVNNQAQKPSSYVSALFGNEYEKAKDSDPSHEEGLPIALVDQTQHGIKPETARKLFPNTDGDESTFVTSVSAMEEFYKNPYEYFLDHGLRLKVVEPYQLDAALEGTYYHSVLEHAVDLWMDGNHAADSSPTVEEICDCIDKCSGLSAANVWDPSHEDRRLDVLRSSNRMRAVHRQLADNLKTFIEQLDIAQTDIAKNLNFNQKKIQDNKNKEGKRNISFVPLATEHEFGEFAHAKKENSARNKAWPYLGDSVVDGIPVRIRGKVDRIDAISVEGLPEDLLILDYKSSAKQLFGTRSAKDSSDTDNGTNVFYGHELQLLTYAAAAKANNPGRTIAGAMFLPIKTKASNWDKSRFANLRKETGMDGDSSSLTYMFTGPYGINAGVRMMPAKCNLHLNTGSMFVENWSISGERTKYWHFAADETDLLCRFALSKIHTAATHVLDGNLPIKPYRIMADDPTKSRDGMQYSDYRSVMALDIIDDTLYEEQRPMKVAWLLDMAATAEQA